MGMDVIGRNAVDSKGEYFRASVWSWRPLHELIKKLCGDLIDEDCLTSMGYNRGAGPEDPDVCKAMSDRFRDWLSSWNDDTYFPEEEPDGSTPEAMLLEFLGQQGMPNLVPKQSGYWVDRESLEAWTEFLGHCGGFQVW